MTNELQKLASEINNQYTSTNKKLITLFSKKTYGKASTLDSSDIPTKES